MSWTQQEIKRLNIAASFFSALILLVVVFMRKIHIETNIDFSFLPIFHSSLNAVAGIVLIFAYIQIRKGNIQNHKRLMSTALIMSGVFLISYVLYHITTPELRYCGEGPIRAVYFLLLISHVVLSGISFPFILFTFIRGLTDQRVRHKKLAKIVFPVWLYICISGPICFLMLYPCMR